MTKLYEKALIDYAKTFLDGNKKLSENVNLKLAHMFRVKKEALKIAEKEKLNSIELIEYAALFHDISRFEQFKQFSTYSDAQSFDHGEYSVKLLKENPHFIDAKVDELGDIFTAISIHNKVLIPENLNPRALMLCKVLRDADKLDIMPILFEYARQFERGEVCFSLSTEPVISPKIIYAIENGLNANYTDMITIYDFIASKYTWLNDLNYQSSKEEFINRGYFEKIKNTLPKGEEFDKLHQSALKMITW